MLDGTIEKAAARPRRPKRAGVVLCGVEPVAADSRAKADERDTPTFSTVSRGFETFLAVSSVAESTSADHDLFVEYRPTIQGGAP